ncbi:hypothetical protein Nepgr_012118 [Nepenthes gracilis]|uniref:GPI mannosyltransferase 2 n=1 Tax=Nepenthes gracilis TaxID=150966 RepID=A0AAD3SGR7_NEPGR|nr:hypothetical protein Nepgr_012118 [Nepenthes gracilis]
MLEASHTHIVLRWAIASRITLLTLMTMWRSLLSPYDTSASLDPYCLYLNSSTAISMATAASADTILFPWIAASIEKSIVWDSVYFIRIAKCGYEYEHFYAFFPLLPVFISLLANTVLRPFIPIIGYRAVLALSGYVINNVAFLVAAVYFYRLSVRVLKDPDASLRASILFCYNPASIFYSSIYSESLYALFSIGGLYVLMSSGKSISVLCFALSGAARSNGVLNAGYFCFQIMHQSYNAIFVKKRAYLFLQIVIAGVVLCICILIPFLAFQSYGYYHICRGHSLEEMRPWCKARIPLMYNFIQSHYWGVGFLRYFQLKQLPNFLLAAPILSLAACSIYMYVKAGPTNFFNLGFGSAYKEKKSAAVLSFQREDIIQKVPNFAAAKQEHQYLKRRLNVRAEDTKEFPAETVALAKSGYYSIDVLPFVLHLGFMAATAFFVMHVQVATRFMSASPPLYWFASSLMSSSDSRKWAYLIWVYSAAYILLGSLLFSNFYPFT